jgi:hypothetical protein
LAAAAAAAAAVSVLAARHTAQKQAKLFEAEARLNRESFSVAHHHVHRDRQLYFYSQMVAAGKQLVEPLKNLAVRGASSYLTRLTPALSKSCSHTYSQMFLSEQRLDKAHTSQSEAR